MKLPWKKKLEEKEKEIEELEQEVEELEEEKEHTQDRFEAERRRRRSLSREKQEAEKELNRLKDKVKEQGSRDEEGEESGGQVSGLAPQKLELSEVENLLHKLGSIKSEEDNLVTLKSPSEVTELDDLKALKNSISKEQFSQLEEFEGFAAFLDDELGSFVLKTRPVFDSGFSIDNRFEVEFLQQFIEEEKTWALVAAGKTLVFEEQSGEFEEVERIKTRVDKQHKKGGFSQGRFEKKREEQVKNHLGEVEEVLGEFENVYLLGEKQLCKELPGTYLGGFDPNASRLRQFYQFQLVRF